MAGFVKLDAGILESTLWAQKDARDVFITALLMASPHELRAPTPEIETRSLAHTGFVVPPGWYGFVPAAGVGIIHRAGIADRGLGMKALERLASPEPDSRSPDHDGRRMVRIDGGFIILNYVKYRDRDYTAAARSKRWRDRKKKADATRIECDVTRNITQAEAEAEAEMDGLMDGRSCSYQDQKGGTDQSPVPGRLAGSAPVAAGDVAQRIVARHANGNGPSRDDRGPGGPSGHPRPNSATAGGRRALA